MKFLNLWPKRFLRSGRGNVAPMLALAAVPLFACVGAGIDCARFTAARTDIQATVDAAVLAGTTEYSRNGGNGPAAIALAQKYYAAQVQTVSYELSKNNVTFSVNDKKNGLIAKGDVDMRTDFIGLIGFETLPIYAATGEVISVAEAGGSGSSVEVSVMLDVTGSMCDDGSGPCTSGKKISGVKSAATALVDNLIWADQSKYTSKVALVPFNTMVRVEPDGHAGALMKKLTNLDPTWSGWYQTCTASTGSWTSGGTEGGGSGDWKCVKTANVQATNWKLRPCVTDRFYNAGWSFDLTDDAPGANRWMNAASGGRHGISADSSDTPLTSGTGASASDPMGGWNYTTDGACYETANSNTVVPLTNSKSSLDTAIAGLSAAGGTGGALGTAFTWFMMSPNWSSVWTGSSTPGSYGDLTAKNASGAPKLRKIAVLMTDGGYNAYRSWKGQDINFVSTNAKSICSGMKAKGIEVYAVGFDFANLTSAEQSHALDTLQSCATDAKHFYNSSSSADLVAAFTEIAKKIANDRERLTN